MRLGLEGLLWEISMFDHIQRRDRVKVTDVSVLPVIAFYEVLGCLTFSWGARPEQPSAAGACQDFDRSPISVLLAL